MRAQYLLGRTASEIPQNGAGIKAAGKRRTAIFRDGERTDGTAMSAQLRQGRYRLERQTG